MKVLIIEDEPLVAKDITNVLKRVEPDCEIVGVTTSVEQSRKWFNENPCPDLVLSDIQLSDGTSFDIFENTDISCSIIFTTAYDEYAIRAFKLNSIDYLLKPIDGDELRAAFKKYRALQGKAGVHDQLKSLMQHWGKAQKFYKERFLVMHGNSLVPVNQNEIGYFHKEQLIFLHTLQNEKYICDFHALDDVEEFLDPSFFFRVNRQFIIHVQSVGKVKTTHKGLTVILKSPMNIEIDISREKATAFKNWLG
jgi:two-component system, LytTR family, response regulator